MEKGRREIVRLNIERYERLLASETDPSTLRTLRTLLAEARGEELLIRDEGALEQATEDAAALRTRAGRWRMQAEEYRTVAEATVSEAARHAYLRLARSYQMLAERAESTASRAERGSKAG